MVILKKYCGSNLLEIEGEKVKEYCGMYRYELRGDIVKEYCGSYLYEINGFLSHRELMMLIAILFA